MASLQSSFVYLSIAGDHTGKEVARATMADDPDKLRQINQAIESAHDLWNAWAIANSGEVLSIEGDYLRIRVPTEKLREVSDLRRRYSETLQAPVSIGFGTKLSEADQALKAAQKRGGDQILMFSPQIQELLEEKDELQKNQKLTFEEMKAHLAAKQARIKDLAQTTSGSAWKTPNGVIVVGLDPHNRDQWRATMVDDAGEPHGHNVAPSHEEALKLALGAGADIMQEPLKALKKGEEGDLLFSLKKEEPPLNSPAGGGGMTGPHQNAPAAPTAPTNEADEHSENEALRSAIMEGQGEGKLTGASPEGSSPDLHALLGEIATQQGQKDQSDQQAQQTQAQDAEGQDKMRQQVIQILKVFKDRSQELEGLQQQDPELYESMTGMLQIMTELAKDYFGQPQNEQDAQMVKSELIKGWPKDEKENQANAEHDAVLKDKLMGEGVTYDAPTVPYKNPVKLVGKGGKATAERVVAARDTNRVGVAGPAFTSPQLVRKVGARGRENVDVIDEPTDFQGYNRQHALHNSSSYWRGVDEDASDDLISPLHRPEGVWTLSHQFLDTGHRNTDNSGGARLFRVFLHSPTGAFLESYGQHALHELWNTDAHSRLRNLPTDVLEYFRRSYPRQALPDHIRPHAEAWDQLNPLKKALPRTPEENAANMQHEQVLQDMLSEKGRTFTGDQLPSKVEVNPRTQPRGIARREAKRPWSQTDHARIRAAETANTDVDSTARFDSLASLPTAVNSQFQIPSFSFQPLGGTPPHAYRFSHYEIPLDYPQEIIHAADDRGGRIFEYKLERGVPYIEVHGPRPGLIKLHPDRAERVYGSFPEDLQRHVFQHTQTLRDAMNPQSKTPMIGETGKVQHSLAQAPDATEMRAAMGSSPAFNKKLKKKDLMPGGKGDDKPDSAFDKEQLEAGAKLEAEEHGLDPARAREIAKDHLSENPNYYKRSMKKAWPKDEKENQANAASHAVLQDVLEERGAAPVDPKTLPDTLENKIVSMGRSPTNPEEPRYRTDKEKGAADARRHDAMAYNRRIRIRDQDQLRNDPDIVAAAHAGPLGYTGAMFPEEPVNQEWPYSVIAPFGGGPRPIDGGEDTIKEDERADRDYWTAVDKVTGKEASGPVDQSDIRLRSPILKRSKPPLDKAALEAGKTGRHKVNYPVGTQIDGSPSGNHEAGEVKVQDPETGLTKWRSVRAGMVMAPDGTKTSSRNPGGSSGERQ